MRVVVGAEVDGDFPGAGTVETKVDGAVVERPVFAHRGCATAGRCAPSGNFRPVGRGIR